MLSVKGLGQEWEIWMHTTRGDTVHVSECGLFASRVEADHAHSALLLWFRQGVWADEVFDRFRPRVQRELFRLRQSARRDGLTAGDVWFTVHVFGAGPCHATGATEPDELEDTTVLPPNELVMCDSMTANNIPTDRIGMFDGVPPVLAVSDSDEAA